jgi:hypothetical protein
LVGYCRARRSYRNAFATIAPYIASLRKADEAWEAGNYDINDMAIYLAGLLQDQLKEAADAAAGN